MYRIINHKKRVLTWLFDRIGSHLFRPFSDPTDLSELDSRCVKEILVIRTAYIGDVVMTLPILKPLRARFPHASITFLTSSQAAPLLAGNPNIDQIIEFNPFWFYRASPLRYPSCLHRLRKKRFDLVLEARGDFREILFLAFPLKARYRLGYDVGGGGFLLTHIVPHPAVNHRILYHLDMVRFLGAAVDSTQLEWEIPEAPEEHRHIMKILQDNEIRFPFWCAHPGSRLPLKKWGEDQYVEAFNRISETLNCPLVLLGDSREVEEIGRISIRLRTRYADLTGRLTLRELTGIIRRSSLLVCNDSAPMHIGAVVNTPTLGIFGPSKSAQTGPIGSHCAISEIPISCRERCDEHVCTNPDYHACMKGVTVSDVVETACRIWQVANGGKNTDTESFHSRPVKHF